MPGKCYRVFGKKQIINRRCSIVGIPGVILQCLLGPYQVYKSGLCYESSFRDVFEENYFQTINVEHFLYLDALRKSDENNSKDDTV